MSCDVTRVVPPPGFHRGRLLAHSASRLQDARSLAICDRLGAMCRDQLPGVRARRDVTIESLPAHPPPLPL